MAKKQKEYSSIIDAFLDDRTPDWKELGLKDAVKSGETQLKRTHDFIDGDVLEEISESIESHHTMLPGGGKGGKKKLVGSVPEDWARHSQNAINEDSVLGEALHDLESKIHSNDSGLEKAISDTDVIGRIDKILGSGLSAAEKTAALKKLGEIELFNKGMATDYLNRTAPQLGINYLEPNTYMDKNSPTYEREDVNLASEDDPFGEITPITPVSGPIESEDANMDIKTSKKGSGPALLASYGYKVAAKCSACGHVQEQLKNGYCDSCWEDRQEQKELGGEVVGDFSGKEAAAKNVFMHESGASIKVSSNGWSYRAKGGVEQNSGSTVKSLVAYLNRIHAKQAPVEAGQRSPEVSVLSSSQSGMRRNTEQKFAHTTSQVAAQTVADFDSGDIEKFRNAGQSLSHIYRFAEAKVGTLGASKAINEWLRGKRQAGKVVLASSDAAFLRDKMGYRIPTKTEVRAAEVSTINRELKKQAAPVVQTTKEFTSGSVEKLHKAGKTLPEIYGYAEKKVGSVIASQTIKAWVRGKQAGDGVVLGPVDITFLKEKFGFKQREAVVNVHKQASTSPVDGMAMLNEFDLTKRTASEISTNDVKFEDIEMGGIFRIDL